MNAMKTAGLLGLLTALILLIGRMLGGNQGMAFALVLAAVMNFASYWFSDKIVLAMHRAKEVTPQQAPRLHAITERLVARAGIPKPRLFLLPEAAPNAFATGRNPAHAAVAATSGLLELMDDEELEGVIAHELAHVAHRDILIASIAATLAGAISMIASMAQWAALLGGFGGRDREEGGGGAGILGLLFTIILAPIIALILQMAVSRSREYAADDGGAKFAGNPYGLARALEKLGHYAKRIPLHTTPAASHLFIVAPLTAGQAFATLFSTHPPLEERVRRLRGHA